MCGRFSQSLPLQALLFLREINQSLDIDDDFIDLIAADYTPHHNIAPTMHATVLHSRADGGQRRLHSRRAHFGLVPRWAKERSVSAKMINARSETLWEKPAFREPIQSRRAILPIDGFYEWQAVPTQRTKQPWYVWRADERPMLLACLWDTWLDPTPQNTADPRLNHEASPLDSFSIITTDANEQLKDKHHRMPVILEPESLDTWLDPGASPRTIRELLRPSPDGVVAMHRVSSRVNSPANNDPALREPDADAPPATLWG